VNDVPDADRTPPAGEAIPGAAEGATGRADDAAEPLGSGSAPTADPEQVMDLLADHVPLALLMDLVTPQGPASAEILRDEGMPDDAWWEPEEETESAEGPAAPLGSDPASDDPEATV
jgi:hypothetical protein